MKFSKVYLGGKVPKKMLPEEAGAVAGAAVAVAVAAVEGGIRKKIVMTTITTKVTIASTTTVYQKSCLSLVPKHVHVPITITLSASASHHRLRRNKVQNLKKIGVATVTMTRKQR